MTRLGLLRCVRATVASVAGVVMLTSLAGCGASNTLLGIHDAPAAKASTVPLTVEHAKKILTRSFTAAYLGETSTGKDADRQLRTAYSGEGLRAVVGRTKQAGLRPPVEASSLRTPYPKLLAVSRGSGFPRFIVAQTVASDGRPPILHLLTSPDAATPYRISMSVDMVPPATIKPFDPLSKGSPLVKNGQRPQVSDGSALAVVPDTLLRSYGAHLAFPSGSLPKPPFAPDSFAGQIRAGAAEVAKDVASQATFTQGHEVVPSEVYAVQQAGGDALVFGVVERKDSFDVKQGQKVSTAGNKAFVRLTGKKLVSRSASMTTLEFVVFAVPRSTGQATLVAAREQIVAGSGS